MTDVNAQPSRRHHRLWKRLLFSGIAGLLLLAILEGALTAFLVVREISREYAEAPQVASLKEDSHCKYDEELGWVHIPSTQIPGFYESGATITINADGVRGADADQSYKTRDEAFRVVCLGDSFTLGYGVDDRSTYPWQLQKQLEGVEVINMGQGGYSVGQSWLWLERMIGDFQPDVVVGVFIIEDFRRLLVTRTANGYATPQFELQNSGIVVSNIPVPARLSVGAPLVQSGIVGRSLLKHSSLAQAVSAPFRVESFESDQQCMLVGSEIMLRIDSVCRSHACEFVLVLAPTMPDLHDRPTVARYEAIALALRGFCETKGIPFRDLWPDFEELNSSGASLFLAEQFHHYNSAGNTLVADALSTWLPAVVADWPSKE